MPESVASKENPDLAADSSDTVQNSQADSAPSASADIESFESKKHRGEWKTIEDETLAGARVRPRKRDEEFRPSIFGLRFKLVTIISIILIGAISGMIIAATYFFRKESETLIQENNLSLTRMISSRTELELQNLIIRSRGMLEREKRDGSPFPSGEETGEIIFVGVGELKGDKLSIRRSLYNASFTRENNLQDQDLRAIILRNSAHFRPVFNGKHIVANLSPGSPVPLLALGAPTVGEKINLILADPAGFWKTFSSQGLAKSFMVDERGHVVAHHLENYLLAGKDLSGLPIVSRMLKSKLNNLLLSYTDEKGIAFMGSFRKLNRFSAGVVTITPEKDAFAALRNLQYRNLMLMGIFLAMGVLIGFYFSRRITRPIVLLAEETKKVEAGDYSVDIKPSSRDEIGYLSSSFISMARGLEEKENIKNAMIKLVSTEIAEKAMRGEIKLGGERKKCTILFVDIRNFTDISDRMEPESVVELLNTYFTNLVNWVMLTGGVVDKFVGDALLAYWGALGDEENLAMETENAINAALLMRWSLGDMNKKHEGEWPFLRIGCGINTGSVIAGQIGSEERMQYTVVGDAVNVASRVEALNKPLGTDILITHDTYKYVKDVFRVEEMPTVRVKGKKKNVVTYTILGRHDDPNSPTTLTELKNRIYGERLTGSFKIFTEQVESYDHFGEKGPASPNVVGLS